MTPLQPPTGIRAVPLQGHGLAYAGTAVVLGLGLLACWTALNPAQMVAMGGAVTAVRVIMGVIGVVFVAIGVVGGYGLAVGGNRVPLYAIDQFGVRLWTRTGAAEVPWDRVIAIGVGWKRSPAPGQLVKFREGFVLEVFVTDPHPGAGLPRAGRLWVTEDPPFPGLPPHRLRLPLVERGVEESVAQQVLAIAPDRFLGSYQRRWHRMPGS